MIPRLQRRAIVNARKTEHPVTRRQRSIAPPSAARRNHAGKSGASGYWRHSSMMARFQRTQDPSPGDLICIGAPATNDCGNPAAAKNR